MFQMNLIGKRPGCYAGQVMWQLLGFWFDPDSSEVRAEKAAAWTKEQRELAKKQQRAREAAQRARKQAMGRA